MYVLFGMCVACSARRAQGLTVVCVVAAGSNSRKGDENMSKLDQETEELSRTWCARFAVLAMCLEERVLTVVLSGFLGVCRCQGWAWTRQGNPTGSYGEADDPGESCPGH